MKKFLKALGIIFLALVLIIGALSGVVAVKNTNVVEAEMDYASSIEQVMYEEQLKPTLEDDGYFSFKTDGKFKVMQLTDVHFGAGFMSQENDYKAINAVANMISAEKPDLVVITGDMAFPVPFIAGTFNNKNPAKLLAQLMEQLGVYWCLVYGNHDTEKYSYYDRADISELYENRELYPHCLFQQGPAEVDGYGNYIINIHNSTGEITQSLVMIDSHAYTDKDPLGIKWDYDCVHENQIEWYSNQIAALTEENAGITPKSLAFMHIPMLEVNDAYEEYKENGYKDTDRVKYLYGVAGETDELICSSKINNGLFDAMKQSKSTQGVFFGHDHLNNFSVIYDGIALSYGYSIDYLAYTDIDKYGAQRGCNIIELSQDGSYKSHLESYYQDKYNSQEEKAEISFDAYGSLNE